MSFTRERVGWGFEKWEKKRI